MKNRFFESFLNHTDDGVLFLSRDGVVLSANSHCATRLSIPSDKLVGQAYSWLFFHETENQELSQIINDGLKKDIEYQLQEIVYKSPQNTTCTFKVSTMVLGGCIPQTDEADSPALLVFFKAASGEDSISAISDGSSGSHQEMRQLTAEVASLKEQNQLLSAHRMKRDLFHSALAGVVFFIILVIIFSSQNSIRIFPKTIDIRANNPVKQMAVARLDTLPRLLRVSGLLEPYYKVTLTAQTSGPIVKMNFNQGDFVEKGHILYQLDTKEIAKGVRTARVAYIELLENYNQLQDWQSSLEVMQAKRSLELAKIAESNEKKKLEETKKLFEKGIIPRVEFDQANTTYKKTGYDYENAKQQLETTTEKGGLEKIEVLKLKLSNAKEELDEIEARYEASVVRAPVAGMIMAPEASDGRHATIKKEGDLFKEGDLIVTIGATESFIINTQVGELSAKEIEVDQSVEISGLSFANILLKGKVDRIAATATFAEDGRYFPVRISIPEVPPEARKKVRFGMQAEAAIRLASLEAVVTIPIEAVSRMNGKDVVLISHETGNPETRLVQPGYSDGSKIVIEKGLHPGEIVLVPVAL
jgi:HlyD family secretion protein